MAGERPDRPVTYWSKMEEKSCWQEAVCSVSKWVWASLWEAWKWNAGCSVEVEAQAQALELSREERLCSEAPAPREAVTSSPFCSVMRRRRATWLELGQESWCLWSRSGAHFQREVRGSPVRRCTGPHKLRLCLLLFTVKNMKCSHANLSQALLWINTPFRLSLIDIADWEQLFDRIARLDDRDKKREKATTECVRQHAHHVYLFLFSPPLILSLWFSKQPWIYRALNNKRTYTHTHT